MIKLCFIITDWHIWIILNSKRNTLLPYPNLPSGSTLVNRNKLSVSFV